MLNVIIKSVIAIFSFVSVKQMSYRLLLAVPVISFARAIYKDVERFRTALTLMLLINLPMPLIIKILRKTLDIPLFSTASCLERLSFACIVEPPLTVGKVIYYLIALYVFITLTKQIHDNNIEDILLGWKPFTNFLSKLFNPLVLAVFPLTFPLLMGRIDSGPSSQIFDGWYLGMLCDPMSYYYHYPCESGFLMAYAFYLIYLALYAKVFELEFRLIDFIADTIYRKLFINPAVHDEEEIPYGLLNATYLLVRIYQAFLLIAILFRAIPLE